MSDTLAELEAWVHEEKCRAASIEIDDGYGATCWRVELHRGKRKVFCSETTFISAEGIAPLWHEQDGNLYCCVVGGDEMDDWPGLAATIKRAIECANEFFSFD